MFCPKHGVTDNFATRIGLKCASHGKGFLWNANHVFEMVLALSRENLTFYLFFHRIIDILDVTPFLGKNVKSCFSTKTKSLHNLAPEFATSFSRVSSRFNLWSGFYSHPQMSLHKIMCPVLRGIVKIKTWFRFQIIISCVTKIKPPNNRDVS